LEQTLGISLALEYGLTGGDDYCLLAAISPDIEVPDGGFKIGSLISSKTPSIMLDGKALPPHWKMGWDHSR
jgi:thiamine monophosphate kinase